MIRKITWNGLPAVEIKAGGYEALLVPSVGSNMVRLYNTEKQVSVFRTPKDAEVEVFKERPQIFGLPLLFPPNRIEDGKYTYEGVSYNYPITIPAQNNHHHGTIRFMPFVVTKCEEGKDYAFVETAFFSNRINNEIYSYFPHNFECRMSFRLSVEGLEHTVKFVNLDAKPMPVGVGYHTPINVPFMANGKESDYLIRMSVGKRWELDERTLPTGNLLDLTEKEAKLRTEGIKPTGEAYELALTNEPLEVDGKPFNGTIITDTKNGTSVYYEVDSKMKHWTFWNNGGGVTWACPEPQSWAINAPNLKLPAEVTGFAAIEPNGTWSSTAKVYVK